MAPHVAASVLFHPKKQPIFANKDAKTPRVKSSTALGSAVTSGTSARSQSPQRPRPGIPRSKPREDPEPDQPEGSFSEYKLVSSKPDGHKYDVMKFDSRKTVDINTWTGPIKLNRKDTGRSNGAGESDNPAVSAAVGPMLGPDGKPVVGMDGRVVMVDTEGKPIQPGEQHANGSADGGKGKDKDKPSAAKKKFQKKTRQVFLVPEHIRQLRKEERYPWVIEDATGQEVWIASMEEASKAETQAMFVHRPSGILKFVLAHRWYKFQKKPHYHVPNLEEAEELVRSL